MSLTGERNTDLVILLNISNEKDFLSLCQTNTKAAEYCNDENLLMSRLNKYYPNTLKWKGRLTPWKEYYLQIMYYIGKLEELGFIYSKDSTGLPSKYYYYLNDPLEYFEEIAKKQYLDLLLHVIRQLNLKDINAKRFVIFEYSPTSFIEKHFNDIWKIPFSHDNISRSFEMTALGGRWDNYKFLLKKFPEHNIRNETLHLVLSGDGGNKEIINFVVDKFSKNINNEDSVYLAVALGAYRADRKDLGDEFYSKIKNLENIRVTDIDAFGGYMGIGIRSENEKLLDKIIKELSNVDDRGELLYVNDFVLSFESLCTEKSVSQCKKLLKMGVPKKIKKDLLEILVNFLDFHELTSKTYEELKFYIETE